MPRKTSDMTIWDETEEYAAEVNDDNELLVYPNIQPDTHYIQTIETEHYQIHAGNHYFVDVEKTLGNGGTLYLGIQTPDTAQRLHILFTAGVSKDATVHLHEDTTYTGGIGLTAYNNDRNSSNTTTATFVQDPTVTDFGTEIIARSFDTRGTLAVTSGQEIILKQNSKYIVEIESNRGGNPVYINLEFYEVSFP